MKNLIEFLKIAAKDKVDMIALLILLIVAIVDLLDIQYLGIDLNKVYYIKKEGDVWIVQVHI